MSWQRVLLVLAWIAFVWIVMLSAAMAGSATNCASFLMSDNDNEASAVIDVVPYSTPWTAWLAVRGGSNGGTASLRGYGPCLDSATPCRRSVTTLGNVTTSTPLGGPGPVESVSVVSTTPCSTLTCVGGANVDAACSADSECPSSTCGPCKTIISFCGAVQTNP